MNRADRLLTWMLLALTACQGPSTTSGAPGPSARGARTGTLARGSRSSAPPSYERSAHSARDLIARNDRRAAAVHLRDALQRLEADRELAADQRLGRWREIADLAAACRAAEEEALARGRIAGLLEAAESEPGAGAEREVALLAARVDWAEARSQVGDHTQAVALLTEVCDALDGRKDLPCELALRAHHARGRTLHQAGDAQGASDELEPVLRARVLSLGPSDPLLARTKLDTALVRKALGDLEGARLLLEDVLTQGESVLGRVERTQARIELAEASAELGHQTRMSQVLLEVIEELRELEGLPEGLALRQRLSAFEARMPPEDLFDLDPEPVGGLGDLLEARRRSVIASFGRLRPPAAFTGESGLPSSSEIVTSQLPGYVRVPGTLPYAPPGMPPSVTELGEGPGLAIASMVMPTAVQATIAEAGSSHWRALLRGYAPREGPTPTAQLLSSRRAELDALAATLPARDPRLFDARLGLAWTGWDVGGSVESLTELDRLLEQGRATRPSGDPALREARWQLAIAKRELGDPEGARVLLLEVLEEREASLPASHVDIHTALAALAWTQLELGETHEASKLVIRLLDRMRRRVRDCWARGPREARELARVELGRLAEGLSLVDALGSSTALERDVFGLLEALRLLSTPLPPRLVAESPELDAQRAEASLLRAELAELCLRGPESPSGTRWATRVRELEDDLDQLGEVLRSAQPDLRELLARTGPAQLAEALAPGAAVLTFWRHERTQPTIGMDREGDSQAGAVEARYSAFLVHAGGGFQRFDLGPAEALETSVEACHRALGVLGRARGGGRVAPTEGEPLEASEELLGRLLAPLEPQLDDVRELHLCLDGPLHLLPLECLAPTHGVALGERFQLCREVSLARILAPASEAKDRGHAVAGLLLCGDVDFDAELDPAVPRSGDRAVEVTPPIDAADGQVLVPLEPLPGTAREVERVAALFTETGHEGLNVLTGSRATKDALRTAASNARYVHVATHGWAAAEALPALGDWQPGASSVVRGFAPLVLCGVALAGANRGRDELGRVPGILTAEELSGFELGGAELVVLSACETGLGLVRAGQGVHSLQTALHAAGARSAITSLWRVPDEATAAFMQAFYRALWHDGRSKLEALNTARQELRDGGAPMRDWAGWVLTGEAR